MMTGNEPAKDTTFVVPTGVLVAIGGNEDKEKDLEILKTTVGLACKERPNITLITTASSVPEETAGRYLTAFAKLDVGNVHVLHFKTREDANTDTAVELIGEADVMFFSGGDQLRLTTVLGGSTVLKAIRRKYFEEGCVVAGTSAGASALSETMIYEGESCEALKKGIVQMTSGMGLVRKVIIDSHFIKRGRFSRLMAIITTNPGVIGLGLGEDTAIIIRDGHIAEAIGNGLIVVFDGKAIQHTNVADIDMGSAIAVQNMIVHTLPKGYGYDLSLREYLVPKNPPVRIYTGEESR